MTQPKGYIDPKSSDYACLLKRSLYGLKQSPKQWYLRFDEFTVTHGYLRCSFDVRVYNRVVKSGNYILKYNVQPKRGGELGF